jgi:hypothetical protein
MSYYHQPRILKSIYVPPRERCRLGYKPVGIDGISVTYELLPSAINIEIDMHAIERAL